jgi:hypothetical protein
MNSDDMDDEFLKVQELNKNKWITGFRKLELQHKNSILNGVTDLKKLERMNTLAKTIGYHDLIDHDYCSRWLIHEHGLFSKIQRFIKFLVLLFQLDLYPFVMAFRLNWGHYGNTLEYVVYVELFFLSDMIINFFREYTPKNGVTPIKDLRLCAIQYLKTKFIIDFIAILPFQMIRW